MKTKKKMGGPRPGSGRKRIHPEGKTQRMTITIPESLKSRIDQSAKKQKTSASILTTDAIRQYLDK